MNRLQTILLPSALALCCFATCCTAQETRESAVANMRALNPSELDSSYYRQAPYAQWLIDRALQQHPNAILIGMHVTPPGSSNNVIIASNFARIGKLADKDDLHVINTGVSNFDVEPSGKMFEAEIPLHAAGGKTIGAISIVFNYKAGDDEAKLTREAKLMVSDMNKKITSAEQLFQAAPSK